MELWYDNGGMKLLVCRNLLVRHNLVSDVIGGPGIWLDFTNVNCRVTQNVVTDVQGMFGGIFIEASQVTNWVDHNVLWNIKGNGIYQHDCDELVVAYNLMAHCSDHGVRMQRNEGRMVGGRVSTCKRNRVANNLFVDNAATVFFSDPENSSDHNLFWDSGREGILAEWQKASGKDAASVETPIQVRLDREALRLLWSAGKPVAALPVDVAGMAGPGATTTLPGPFREIPIRLAALALFPQTPGIVPAQPKMVELKVADLQSGSAERGGPALRGYLLPPETGWYTFWIAGPGKAELRLGADYLPNRVARIARLPGASEAREWSKYPEQRSEPVFLRGGRMYYLEARGAASQVSLAWSLPETPSRVLESPVLKAWKPGPPPVPPDARVVRAPSLPQLTQLADVPAALAGAPVLPAFYNGARMGDFQIAATRTGLAVYAKVKEPRLARAKAFQDGSGIELFCHGLGPDSKVVKMHLLPAVDKLPAEAWHALPEPATEANRVLVGSTAAGDGYTLAALIPFEELGIIPANGRFLLEAAVYAVPPNDSRQRGSVFAAEQPATEIGGYGVVLLGDAK